MHMNIWRIAGLALVAGLALFLLSVLLKLMLVAAAVFLLVRVVGSRLAGPAFGKLRRGNWPSADIISIDNPAYRSPMNRARYERIVPIS